MLEEEGRGAREQLVVLRSVRMSAFPLSGASDRRLSLSVTLLSLFLARSLTLDFEGGGEGRRMVRGRGEA